MGGGTSPASLAVEPKAVVQPGSPPAGTAVAQPAVAQLLVSTPSAQLPKFDPMSAEFSACLRLGTQEKVRIAWLQMEKEDGEREFQFRWELELKTLVDDTQLCLELELRKLEVDTTVRMRELELKAKASSVSVGESLSSTSGFVIGKNIPLILAFRESEVESYYCAFQ